MDKCTIRAETITELILERAGPATFKTSFTGVNSFQTDFCNLSCKLQEEQALKITGNDNLFQTGTIMN